jgi:hypothetical protein
MGDAMKFVVFIGVLAFSAPLSGQEAVSDWLPMAVGNRWTYEHSSRDGNVRDPRILRWQTEETIVGMRAMAEGTLVFRHIEVEGETPGSWLSRYGESHFLLRNSCLYFLDPSYSWNEQEQQLSPEFRASLVNGHAHPAFCFPLVTGKKFGVDLPGFVPSKVVGMGWGVGYTPPSVTEKAVRVEVHLFEADTTRLGFEKGVGITGVWDLHRGAYSEYRVKLLRFQPAAPVAAGSPHASGQ